MHRLPVALLLLFPLLALLALGGCIESEPPPAAEVPAPLPFHEEVVFDSTLELLEAIESGRYAQRAGIAEEVRTASVPEPVKIEFVSGTDVPADQQDELRALAELLKADDRLVVDLVGCSDPSGSESLNLRISGNRAESVARRLVELGVPESQLREVVGRGEDCEVQERAVNAMPALRESQISES